MRNVKRSAVGFAMLVVLTILFVALSPSTTESQGQTFPESIQLPNGWRPEGIVIGQDGMIYAGSLATGSVYRADLRTGQGEVLVQTQNRVATGLSIDVRTNYLYAAGGPTGSAYVYNAATGASIAALILASGVATFVNDVVVTNDAVYFTDSFRPVLYRVPLSGGGRLPTPPIVQELPLSGDFVFIPGAFNTNGIEATPDGQALIVVNSTDGALYRVDPPTGVAALINLGGASLTLGDGMLLVGHTLYVVQNFLNRIAEVELAPDLRSGAIVRLLTHPDLDIPTTIDAFAGSLYVVNARFTTPPTPETSYAIVKVSVR